MPSWALTLENVSKISAFAHFVRKFLPKLGGVFMRATKIIKALIAALLVTAAMASPALLTSDPRIREAQATLTITGTQLVAHADGSVQMLFDVSVSAHYNSTGAGFLLKYNKDYLTPSVYEDNTPTTKAADITKVFHANETLLLDTDGNSVDPFLSRNDQYPNSSITSTNTANGSLKLEITLNQEKLASLAQKDKLDFEHSLVKEMTYATMEKGETAYVFNPYSNKDLEEENVPDKAPVTLGTISFRANPEKLPEILRYFNDETFICEHREATNSVTGLTSGKKPYVTTYDLEGRETSETTYLVDVDDEKNPNKNQVQSWLIYTLGDPEDFAQATNLQKSYGPKANKADDDSDKKYGDVNDQYKFDFDPNTIVDVAVTDPDVTINAYQNYNIGTTADLITSMGRYSPTVTVTYADGHKENVPFPWGENGYTVKQLQAGTQSPITTYDPTASRHASNYDHTTGNATGGVKGSDYFFSQNYVYTDADGNLQTFPKPVTAHLKVTPITVVDVTAEDLTRTYTLNQDLIKTVAGPEDLELPTQARILTDVVPGDVSLVTPIPGWKPTQLDSTWPTPDGTNSDTLMNSLKADSYTVGAGTPYWPDEADKNTLLPANHCGTYTFQTSDATHTTPQGILRSDIQTQFPWLTVPNSEYTLQNATRKIISETLVTYEASYVSTVTATSTTTLGGTDVVGQPTLTLQVRRADGNVLSGNSVFRVWLPNGLELGTGLTSGGATVTDWFSTNTNGFYTTSQSGNPFDLSTNPADPNTASDAHASDRETLRRYINLGGWYYVSVCEEPNASDPLWCDPIPVYVPPRQNDYQESKIYNFLAENSDLANWPGGLGDTLYLPHGEYTPVTVQNSILTTLGAKFGLPLYGNNSNTTNDGTGRYTESYGIKTTYDGQTGAQPGMVYNVKVTENWKTNQKTAGSLSYVVAKTTVPVYQYGPKSLYQGTNTNGAWDGYAIPGFGRVHNTYSETATLRTNGTEKPVDTDTYEQIKLLSAETFGITRRGGSTDPADNVSLVTFDTKQQGYTVRQDFVLTIQNVGTADIYGLDINSTFDGFNGGGQDSCAAEPAGGHFVLTQAPANFLPVGATTTFTITYVYDLRGNETEQKNVDYHDILYITSNTLHDVQLGGQYDTGVAQLTDGRDDYLMEFEAHFSVSPLDLHKVTVIYNPSSGTMGTANLIVGNDDPANMNFTATARTYSEGNTVFVAVYLKDEYAVWAKTCVNDQDGTNIATFEEITTGPWGDRIVVYKFTMPDADVTVTIDLYEPLSSKLRLENLIDFSAPNTDGDNDGVGDDLKYADDATNTASSSTVKPEHTYKVWQKSFTAAETAAASTWSTGHGTQDENYYLMTVGSAITPASEGQVFDPSQNHYLVVIDAEDDFSQVEATLRRLVYHEDWRYLGPDGTYPNGYNLEVENVEITMELYGFGVENSTGQVTADQQIYLKNGSSADAGIGPVPAFTGHNNFNGSYPPVDYATSLTTNTSSTHISAIFESPALGQSSYVKLTVSGELNDPTVGLETATREYYLEIHRKNAKADAVLYYGNSPYGMIMNETVKTWNAAAKEAAKDKFREGYTFGLSNEDKITYVPTLAQDTSAATDLTRVTYWREAWIYNTGLYEPESYTGTQGSPALSGTPNADGLLVYPSVKDDGTITFPSTEPLQSLYSIKKGYMERMVYFKNGDAYGNLDLDDFAYFAILGENFREPGVFAAYDSSGRYVYKDGQPVKPDGSAYEPGETRRLISVTAEVVLLDTAQTTQIDRFSGTATEELFFGEPGRALSDADLATAGNDVWPVKDNGDGTYTAVESIRPGRYALKYTYLDFDGTSTLEVYRPFVLLSPVGDVNVDGSRTDGSHTAASDEYAVENRVTDPLGYAAGTYNASSGEEKTYPAANLFKFRVCDVNNDRSVNNIDANQIHQNVKDSKPWLRFYKPTDYFSGLKPQAPETK